MCCGTASFHVRHMATLGGCHGGLQVSYTPSVAMLYADRRLVSKRLTSPLLCVGVPYIGPDRAPVQMGLRQVARVVERAVGSNGDGAIGLDGPLPRIGTGAGPVLKLRRRQHTPSEQEIRTVDTVSNPVAPIVCVFQVIDCDIGRVAGFLVNGDCVDVGGPREPIRNCTTQYTADRKREGGGVRERVCVSE